MLYVHEGSGVCDTIFGPLRYGPGDYLVLPIGTTWRLDPDAGSEQRMLYLEAPSEIVPPQRYRNDYGQLLEHAPYSQRDIHAPDEVAAARRARRLRDPRPDRATGSPPTTTATTRSTWSAGTATSGRSVFNIGDFQPITGRVHQPPPVHQTFQARNFVVCSFVPRKFDYHPLAIPAPYNHSNINSDEVIYYVAGNFMSRRGVDIASFTLHPAGIPHGPHPGTVEASIGKEATEELAVMVDTFHPLKITAGRAGPRRRRLPVHLAAARGPRRGSLRARGARPGGVPRLTRLRSVVDLEGFGQLDEQRPVAGLASSSGLQASCIASPSTSPIASTTPQSERMVLGRALPAIVAPSNRVSPGMKLPRGSRVPHSPTISATCGCHACANSQIVLPGGRGRRRIESREPKASSLTLSSSTSGRRSSGLSVAGQSGE